MGLNRLCYWALLYDQITKDRKEVLQGSKCHRKLAEAPGNGDVATGVTICINAGSSKNQQGAII